MLITSSPLAGELIRMIIAFASCLTETALTTLLMGKETMPEP
ncbi:hypothetical protein [Pseudomonas extremaustralis]|nr:hypothetical protein [Pseudomonas extremaustralis]MDR6575941.1 hypothetical protein [Pseudomonas extremaustralis]